MTSFLLRKEVDDRISAKNSTESRALAGYTSCDMYMYTV